MEMDDQPRTLRIDTYRDFDNILNGYILVFDRECKHVEWQKLTTQSCIIW